MAAGDPSPHGLMNTIRGDSHSKCSQANSAPFSALSCGAQLHHVFLCQGHWPDFNIHNTETKRHLEFHLKCYDRVSKCASFRP